MKSMAPWEREGVGHVFRSLREMFILPSSVMSLPPLNSCHEMRLKSTTKPTSKINIDCWLVYHQLTGCQITFGSEAILAGFTRRKIGYQFTEDAVDGTLTDFVVFGFVASIIHR